MIGRVVVVAVGNPWRRDDGVGPAVAATVRSRRADLDVVEVDGEATRIVEAWEAADLAVIVDATRTGARPGTVQRWNPRDDARPTVASSHGTGVQHAVALGRVLGRLPARLEIVGIEGAAFGHGTRLSPAVAAAVDAAACLVDEIVDEIVDEVMDAVTEEVS